jgi:hypothetical protein
VFVKILFEEFEVIIRLAIRKNFKIELLDLVRTKKKINKKVFFFIGSLVEKIE